MGFRVVKIIMTWFCASILLLTALPGCAALKTNDKAGMPLTSGLNQLVQHQPHATISLAVQSMASGQVLYQSNANELLVPASNLKVFTGYAALLQLGPNFTFDTQLLTDAANLQGSTLNGNVYIKFVGDPSLQVKDLEQMIKAIKGMGITRISGKLIVDNSYYDDNGIAPGTLDEDKRYCYGAPINALTLNRNCIALQLSPAKYAGSLAQVNFLQGLAVPIDNTMVTRSSTSKLCHPILKTAEDGRYQLSGCLRTRGRPLSIVMPLLQARAAGLATLKNLLQQQGIVVQNTIVPAPNTGLKLLVKHQSVPVADLVTEMMKHSDNLIANALYKQIGASYFKQTATWENSGQAVKAILTQKAGLNLTGMIMIDGSGLSRFNRVTTNQVLQLLNSAYRHPTLSHYFIASLPISGIDGTLKHRSDTREMMRKVRAKTGSMKGVSSLSGYVENHQHQMMAFSIIVNNFNGSIWQYRVLEDKICRFLSTGLISRNARI